MSANASLPRREAITVVGRGTGYKESLPLCAHLNCHPPLPLPPLKRGAVWQGAAVTGDWQCDGSGSAGIEGGGRRATTGTRAFSSSTQLRTMAAHRVA